MFRSADVYFSACMHASVPDPPKVSVLSPHLLSATVRVYSLVAPCRLPDLTSLALLGSVSGQHGLSRGLLPGYKMVSKWRLQLQDSTPFPLLSQSFAPLYTPQHLWDVISCLLSCQTALCTSWSSLTAVIYVLLGCKHWWCHDQFLPSFSLEGIIRPHKSRPEVFPDGV